MNDSLPIKVQLKNDFIIGIAIATYNSDKVIRRCLNSFKDQKFKVVIFDDASTDKTLEIASSVIPNLIVLNGDGSAWWGGGTARAVDKCFSIGCEFVLMLNPDAIISAEDINKMVEYTFNKSHLITAGLVVRDDDIKKLCWGGSRRINLPGFAMHINKYIYTISSSFKYPLFPISYFSITNSAFKPAGKLGISGSLSENSFNLVITSNTSSRSAWPSPSLSTLRSSALILSFFIS